MSNTLTLFTTIPTDHRIVIDVPEEFPADGTQYRLTLTPVASPESSVFRNGEGKLVQIPRRPSDPKLAAEHDEFLRQLPQLLEKYRNQYVAIYEGKVIGANASRVKLLTELSGLYCGILFYVRLVTDGPVPVERIGPSIREVKQR